MLVDLESPPYKAKRLYSERSTTVQARSSGLTPEAFDNLQSMDFMDTKIVKCRFDIHPPSSRESPRIALNLEPGEVSYFWRKAREPVLSELCFDKSNVAVRLPSKHGFTKFRQSKKLFKSGPPQSGDAAIQPVKSTKGAIRSRPRAARSQSTEPPLVVSQCILGTNYLNATPGNGLT